MLLPQTLSFNTKQFLHTCFLQSHPSVVMHWTALLFAGPSATENWGATSTGLDFVSTGGPPKTYMVTEHVKELLYEMR